MPRIIVYLPDATFAKLKAKAEAGFRDLRQQAALAITRDVDDEAPRSAPADAQKAEVAPEPASARA